MIGPEDQRHGTNAGYQAHHKWGVAMCSPCRTAHAKQHQGFRNRRYLERLPTLLIDPTPTVRRIRALQAIGWPLKIIDAELGGNGKASNLGKMLKQPSIHVDTAARVAKVYDRLHMTPGPSERSRSLAITRGWSPPLGWDDIDNDVSPNIDGSDFEEEFIFDEVAVQQAVDGNYFHHALSKAEKAAVVAGWKRKGRSLAELERLAGWNVHRYTASASDEVAA